MDGAPPWKTFVNYRADDCVHCRYWLLFHPVTDDLVLASFVSSGLLWGATTLPMEVFFRGTPM
jgi:hypothetical protein